MGNEQTKPTDPAAGFRQRSLRPMDASFRHGVQHNIKIVIRGDTMTGKTTLFHQLQGIAPTPNYARTTQIEIANIKWDHHDAQAV
ncbi:hypothetical protein H4R34_005590, partial [Dimargaris verticillata]